MTKSHNLAQSIVRSPILWGAAASCGFYGLIHSGVLTGEYLDTYFAGHPVEYVAATMFFVGLAVLALKTVDFSGQYAALSESLLGPRPPVPQPIGQCESLLRRLDGRPAGQHGNYLSRRLRDAIEHVQRRGSAQGLDDHLKYLADLDAGRLHASFALVRVIIWAIPVLGFLGTVIGITLAIANLDVAPGSMEGSLPQVIKGLSVAFATTTQALLLSIVLMFAQFYTERRETALLDEVDSRAAAELEGRFERTSVGADGQLAAVRRMADALIQTSEQLVRRQAELWQSSMDAAAGRWAKMADSSAERLRTTLSDALTKSLKAHAEQLGDAERSVVRQNHQHWEQVRQTQVQNTQALTSLQAGLVKQGDVLRRAIEASGEVAGLEDALNRNLAALAGARHFEKTVISLSAAIHLLNARLADGLTNAPPVKLEDDPPNTQAA